jgi:putative transposase
MPRRLRFSTGGYVFHVLNRGVARAAIFEKDGDYAAFLRILRDGAERQPMRLLAYCLMPNHWHLVLWPYRDGDLSEYLRWVTVTHVQRWHAHYHSSGSGSLYQGRFKSFPVEADQHLLSLCRYVERNALRAGMVDRALRAGMVDRAEAWPWGSLYHRLAASDAAMLEGPTLDAWPIPRPGRWLSYVNGVETEKELEALRKSVVRGAPYGDPVWQERTARRLGLQSTLRACGRPRKTPEA